MGNYNGAETSKLDGIYILCKLANKKDTGLYKDDKLIIQRNY